MRAFGIHQRRAVVIQIFAIDVQRSCFVYGRQVGSVIHLTMSKVSGSPPKPAKEKAKLTTSNRPSQENVRIVA
jgi:hypothetical protein